MLEVTIMFGHPKITQAQRHELSAKILRKEVEVEGLMNTNGPMSEDYKLACKKLERMRKEYQRLWGGSYL